MVETKTKKKKNIKNTNYLDQWLDESDEETFKFWRDLALKIEDMPPEFHEAFRLHLVKQCGLSFTPFAPEENMFVYEKHVNTEGEESLE